MENDLVLVLVILFVALVAFGLGRLSAFSEKKAPVKMENLVSASVGSIYNISSTTISVDKLYVASKNGTKYHYPWCGGAQSIKEENKIWFSSKEEAEGAGYTPASNCKGL